MKFTRSDIMLISFLLVCICSAPADGGLSRPLKMQKTDPVLFDSTAIQFPVTSTSLCKMDSSADPLDKKSEGSSDNALISEVFKIDSGKLDSWPKIKDYSQSFFYDLISLSTSTADLSAAHNRAMKDATYRIKYWPDMNKKYDHAIEIFQLIQPSVTSFQQFVLQEIKRIASLHPKVGASLEEIAILDVLLKSTNELFPQNNMEVVFANIREKVLAQVSLFGLDTTHDEFDEFWLGYTLKSMNFFCKHDLFKKDWVDRYLDDPGITNEILLYVETLTSYGSAYRLTLGSHSLAEHWSWALDHDLFKTANQDFKNRINAFFIMCTRHLQEITPMLRSDYFKRGKPAVWNEFCGRLKKAEYVRDWKDEPKFDSMNLVDEVENMIEIVAWRDNAFLDPQEEDITIIMCYICDLLGLVDIYHPGLIGQKLLKNPHKDLFDNHRVLLHLQGKINALIKKDDRLREYTMREHKAIPNPTNKFYQRKSRSISDGHLEEFKSLLTEFENERTRVFDKESTKSKLEFRTFIDEKVDFYKTRKQQDSLKALQTAY